MSETLLLLLTEKLWMGFPPTRMERSDGPDHSQPPPCKDKEGEKYPLIHVILILITLK